ncbi:MAG: beta-lactamase family protein [Aeromicrobium sp.]|nr:beta-lactamase family protein [Burkholderiales bacterium]
MKTKLVAAMALLFVTVRLAHAAEPVPTSPAPKPPPASVAAVVAAAEEAGFAGVVLSGDRSRITFEQAVGLADRSRRTPHSVEMVWRWASVSKQITAIIAAQLVVEGKLDLDKPVSTYLNAKEFGSANAKLITIRQLLQHTSGLPNPSDVPTAVSADDKAVPDAMPVFYLEDVAPEAVHKSAAASTCAATPKRAPGERFEYNNCDYLVLGAVIEKITGQLFASVINERIAKPLNLQKEAVRPATIKDKYAQPVKGYEGKRVELTFNLATYGAAGALLGSPRDLFAIDQALLGESLMSAEAKKQFWKGEPNIGYAALGVWSFPATLKGCKEPVELIERRGAIGGVQVRNFLAPALGKVLLVLTNRGEWEFGEVWQGKGFSHDLLSATLCTN